MLPFKYLSEDFKASIVVFLVALPLCLGISLASGAPLLSGIISGIIGGVVVGFFSNSQTSISGPAAGLTVIILDAIIKLGDFQSLTLAILIAGLIQIILGLFKVGKVGAYFPNAVIKGMLSAIGIILILKQIPHAVGFDQNFMGDEAFLQHDGGNTLSSISMSFKALHIGAIIISLLSISSMVLWDKLAKKILFFKLFPSALFAVLLGIILNQAVFSNFEVLSLAKEHLVSLPIDSGFSSFFASFHLPRWDEITNPLIFKVALTLAIVATLETLLSVEAVDKIDTHKRITDKNKEMIAQGAGNLFAGLVGGLPVTSVIVRSSAGITAGGRTKLTAILHGVWMLLAVVLIPRFLELIPLSSLASILILVGYKLCPPILFKQMAKKGKEQLIPFVVTILAILFTDLLVGITVGILVGFAFILKSNSSKAIVVVNESNDYLIRFVKDISFLQKPLMAKILSEIPENSNLVIDGSNHIYVDNDIIALIEEFMEVCEERKISYRIQKSSLAINEFFKG